MANTKKKTRRKQFANEEKSESLQFPGYPQYSPEEDIFRRGKRIDENLSDSDEVLKNSDSEVSSRLMTNATRTKVNNEAGQAPNPSDVTKEDLEALGPKDLSLDMGDDEDLKHRITPVDFTGKNLDVPEPEDDELREEIGSEDEENKLYSQSDSK